MLKHKASMPAGVKPQEVRMIHLGRLCSKIIVTKRGIIADQRRGGGVVAMSPSCGGLRGPWPF